MCLKFTPLSKSPLTVSMQICPFLGELLQFPHVAKAELFGIHR